MGFSNIVGGRFEENMTIGHGVMKLEYQSQWPIMGGRED